MCNTKPGQAPDRAAARGTPRFGRNGLVGIVVERPEQSRHRLDFDRKAVTTLLRRLHADKKNVNLIGSNDPEHPLLGGTYGGAAKGRFENGHGVTNLFRDAFVRVRFHDYGFFLPQDVLGADALVEGRATLRTLSEREARHLAAESRGGNPDAIEGPQRELGFVATGVRVLTSEHEPTP